MQLMKILEEETVKGVKKKWGDGDVLRSER